MNKVTVRNLRKKQTEAEKKIWFHLRNRHFEGLKFRRQHSIGPFITDFCCIEKKIVIEVDGSQHIQNKIYDDNRTKYLNQNGYKVIRFWDNDVLNRCDSVLEAVRIELNPYPHPNPLPERERETR